MKSSRVLLVEIAIDCVGQRLDIGLGLGGVGEILSHDAQNKIIARCAVSVSYTHLTPFSLNNRPENKI